MASDPKTVLASEATTLSGGTSGEVRSTNRLDELARRYYAPLVTFFRKRTRNAPEVPDLVQQVFLRLAQHGDPGRIENADGYIFRTAANTLKDHYRHEIVRERFARDPARLLGAEDSDFPAERVLVGREDLARVTAALRELPERTRDVFMLRCFEGLKHAEIAALYGISVRAIEKHMAKALARLSQTLDEDRT